MRVVSHTKLLRLIPLGQPVLAAHEVHIDVVLRLALPRCSVQCPQISDLNVCELTRTGDPDHGSRRAFLCGIPPIMTSQNWESLLAEEICNRLKRLGYGRSQHVRLYGEQFEVMSDPFWMRAAL